MNINNLDNDIKEYKQQVALGEALERLEVNPDFRMLIERNYLGTHALNLVYSRTRDMTPDNEIARKKNIRKKLLRLKKKKQNSQRKKPPLKLILSSRKKLLIIQKTQILKHSLRRLILTPATKTHRTIKRYTSKLLVSLLRLTVVTSPLNLPMKLLSSCRWVPTTMRRWLL